MISLHDTRTESELWMKANTEKSRPIVQRCFLLEIGIETFARDSMIDNLEAILSVIIYIHTS
jgi:hypothetical protein